MAREETTNNSTCFYMLWWMLGHACSTERTLHCAELEKGEPQKEKEGEVDAKLKEAYKLQRSSLYHHGHSVCLKTYHNIEFV